MALGSFAHDALADLSDKDLGRMLELDETLFVEHKAGLGKDSAHGLMAAVASFANTAGGWLLLGVKDGKPTDSAEPWAQDEDGAPTLIDAVRDRLRGELDPLPAFEAQVRRLADGPVGVVRVYESTDTPHVSVRSGAVYVREVAGGTNAADPGKPQPGARGRRVYEAAQIRSRQQLLELTTRGHTARERAAGLLDLTRPLPLVADTLPLKFEATARGGLQPSPEETCALVARMAPLTLAPRFQGWATTSYAAAAVQRSGEELVKYHGLSNDWVAPDPAGAGIRVPLGPDMRMTDVLGQTLDAAGYVVVDAAGVAGAALQIAQAEELNRREVPLTYLSERLILPVLEAAASVLVEGEFLGRARCQIDILRLGRTFRIDQSPEGRGRPWVSTQGDIGLPAGDEQLTALAWRAATACGRAAGIPTWD